MFDYIILGLSIFVFLFALFVTYNSIKIEKEIKKQTVTDKECEEVFDFIIELLQDTLINFEKDVFESLENQLINCEFKNGELLWDNVSIKSERFKSMVKKRLEDKFIE